MGVGPRERNIGNAPAQVSVLNTVVRSCEIFSVYSFNDFQVLSRC
jgi:hypothetical protein